jgi:hypothetical protein
VSRDKKKNQVFSFSVVKICIVSKLKCYVVIFGSSDCHNFGNKAIDCKARRINRKHQTVSKTAPRIKATTDTQTITHQENTLIEEIKTLQINCQVKKFNLIRTISTVKETKGKNSIEAKI